MATLTELQTRLTVLNAKITAAEGVQSYSTDGFAASRPDLRTLYDERARIETQVARLGGTGGGVGFVTPCT